MLLLPLLQTATIYKHGNALLPTFYTFKVQSVQQVAPSSSSDSSRTSAASAQSAALSGRRKTIAHAKLDLAQFCSAESTGPTTAIAIEVPLEPQGTLHLTVKTVWLQHYDQAKSAQLLQQGCATAQPWGSVSDVESCTDRSSISSSIFGSYLCETERNTCECTCLAALVQVTHCAMKVPMQCALCQKPGMPCHRHSMCAHVMSKSHAHQLILLASGSWLRR